MRHPFSLAARLTLLFGLAATLVFPVFGWFVSRSVENHFAAEDTKELRLIASAVKDALRTWGGGGSGDSHLTHQLNDILLGHHEASLYISGSDGEALYVGKGPNLAGLLHAQPAHRIQDVRRWHVGEHSYRSLVETAATQDAGLVRSYAFAIAVPIDHHLVFLASLRRSLWLAIVASILIMSLLGWLAVKQGHAPLRRTMAQIRRISADRLEARIPTDRVPPELVGLADSFNDMLQRIDESFRRLSEFNADIAHELRTPVTNLMTETQVALSRARTPDEYREVLYSNMEEYERMAQMIGDMLFLAKADNRRLERHFGDVDLGAEIRALFEYYEGWAEERCVSLTVDGSAQVTADKRMLRRAIGNLLSNAIGHSPADATVRVTVRHAAAAVIIAVENPGATIPPEHLPRLFDRFYRVDPSRRRGSEGTGLGLAIVKSIVEAHSGHVDAASREGWTRFTITLPAPTQTTTRAAS